MSNRSMLEFNHDRCPPSDDDAALLKWATRLRTYLSSGHPPDLPEFNQFCDLPEKGFEKCLAWL